mmetsp:Transcript_45536/g.33294  ORF Transcript_45536/g.33294 Transcript_45536/m.33294 type:complete len:196 (-) Transcript_45536:862-1449(-)
MMNIQSSVKLLLVQGTAEVFGKELPLKELVFFHRGEKVAIHTWNHEGATLQFSGLCEFYVSSVTPTPMAQYLNLHATANIMRNQALKFRELGPRILVTGQSQSGKSTLCKILVNYALKLGWTPILCDLDLQNNEVAPPGCIGAALVEEPLPNDDLVEASLCYFHGSTLPVTLEFFDKQVDEMAKAVIDKLQQDLE